MGDDNLLHRTRVDRGIELDQIAARTALNPAIVRAIDLGRFDALPAGIYARSYVRAFASAVGLQPEQVVRQLEPVLPGIDDPLPVLREIALGAAPEWPERVSATINGGAARIGALTSRALLWLAERHTPLPRLASTRVAGATAVVERLRSRSWCPGAARGAAACLDAAVLLLLLAAVVQLTAWTSAAAVAEVLTVAGEQIAALWGVLVLLYFVILGGVGGRTPGAMLCGLPATATAEPLRLRSILERAMLH